MATYAAIVYPDYHDTPVTASAATIPYPTGLITTPGIMPYHLVNRDIQHEGILALGTGNPNAGGGQQLVLSANPDPYLILKCLAKMIGYGEQHQGYSVAQCLGQLRYGGEIYLLCGNASAVFRNVLGTYGYQTREVDFLAVQNLNGYDDGHVAFEVQIGGLWRYVDPIGAIFRDGSGKHLSAAEVVDARPVNCTLELLAPPTCQPQNSGAYGVFSARAWYDVNKMGTVAGITAWAERMMTIPVIGTSCYLPTGSQAEQQRAAGLTVMTKANWLAAFYP